MDRLIKSKRASREKAIETLERNLHVYNDVWQQYINRDIPGASSCVINKRSHSITVCFIAMSVQWYLHTDKVVIQDGNADVVQGYMHKDDYMQRLRTGRSAFRNLSLPKL
jgi:hypothetical protein